MDNQVLPTYKEIFGEVMGQSEDGKLTEILSLQKDGLKTIYIDSDLLIGVKEGEFVNIKQSIQFISTPNNQGGLNKMMFYVRHFTREQAQNLTFDPIREKFEKFIDWKNKHANMFEGLENLSF